MGETVTGYRVVDIPRGSKFIAEVHAETRDQFDILPNTARVAITVGDLLVPIQSVDSEGVTVCRLVRKGRAVVDGQPKEVPKAICNVRCSVEFLTQATTDRANIEPTMASLTVDANVGL